MHMAILPELATLILIPFCPIVGIVFSFIQWIIVSRVKVSADRPTVDATNTEVLIEEEDGVTDHDIVGRCADIQNAISEESLRLHTPREASTIRSARFGNPEDLQEIRA